MVTEHFILAQSSSIDRDSNTISVFQFLEDLTIQTSSPQMHLPVQAVLITRREDERGKIETKFNLIVTDPSQQEVLNQVFTLKMEESHRRSRLRVNFSIPMARSGEYTISIRSDEMPAMNCRFQFLVNLIRQAPRGELPT